MLESPRLTIVMPTMLQNWQICSQTNSQGYLATDGSDVRQIVMTSSVIEVGSYYPSLGNNSTKIITDQHNTRLHLNEPNLKTRGGENSLDGNLGNSSVYSSDKVAFVGADAIRRSVSIPGKVLSDFGAERPAATSYDIDLKYIAFKSHGVDFCALSSAKPTLFSSVARGHRTTGLEKQYQKTNQTNKPLKPTL